MMPNLDGYSVWKHLEKIYSTIISLSALNEEENQVKGFELECDDYIIQAYSHLTLIKVIEVVSRRSTKSNSEELLQLEDLNLNLNTYIEVMVNNRTDFKEFNILKL